MFKNAFFIIILYVYELNSQQDVLLKQYLSD